LVIYISTPKEPSVISLQIHTTENPGGSPVVGSEMTDRRRPDGSYGPEYGPLPPEHEYAMYRHLSSRRTPWLLHHGDGVATVDLPSLQNSGDYVSDDEVLWYNLFAHCFSNLKACF